MSAVTKTPAGAVRRIILIPALALLLTACSPKATPPAEPPTPAPPPEVVTPTQPTPPPTPPAPRTYGQVPDVLARPVTSGGPKRITFAAGDTVSKIGAYFLNVATGKGEAWVYPEGEGSWWSSDISHDNRFVRTYATKAGYLIDRSTGAVWQWDAETVRPVLITEKGSLFAEVDSGRLFWTGPDFKPARTFTLDSPGMPFHALLSPDGQRIALLLMGEKPALLLLDLSSGAKQALDLPGQEKWVGSTSLQAQGADFAVSVWASGGNRMTDLPAWNELIRRYNWRGAVLGEQQIPGNYTFFSPDRKWVAWQETNLLGNLAPVTVVADAKTLRPHLKVLGASTCFASVGSGGTRWLADNSGLVLATNANEYRLLTLDGTLKAPPGFAGLTWKGEPQPAPDKADRFAIGRIGVLDGQRQLAVKLDNFVTAQRLDAWGSTSTELRFTLPPKPGGGACFELPPMPQLVLRAGEPVPEFPLVVQSSECLPLREGGACLPRGTRLKAIPDPNGHPGISWVNTRWHLYIQTESGQKGWIDLSGSPLGWTK